MRTFLLKLSLPFKAFLPHLSLLFTEETLWSLFVSMGKCFAFPFLFIRLLLILVIDHNMCSFTYLLDKSIFLLNTLVRSLLIDHFSLCVLWETFRGSYDKGRELTTKCTRKVLDISIFNDFRWAAMSLIRMICSHTLLMSVNLVMTTFSSWY